MIFDANDGKLSEMHNASVATIQNTSISTIHLAFEHHLIPFISTRNFHARSSINMCCCEWARRMFASFRLAPLSQVIETANFLSVKMLSAGEMTTMHLHVSKCVYVFAAIFNLRWMWHKINENHIQMNCWSVEKVGKTVQNNTQSMQLMSFSTTSPLNWLNRCVFSLSCCIAFCWTFRWMSVTVAAAASIWFRMLFFLYFSVQPEALESKRKNTQ